MTHSMMPLARSLAVSACLFVSTFAFSSPVVSYSGGRAVGVADLVVSGVSYDVSFEFGSYDSVFGAALPTFDVAGATSARDALFAVLNGEAAAPIGPGQNAVLFIPYELTEPDMRAAQLGYQDGTGATWQIFANYHGSASNDNTSRNWGFAVFAAEANDVPEPSSLALLGLGLAGLAAARKRKHA